MTKSPMERYRSDPDFHNMVNQFKNVLETGRLTDYEIREALTLARHLWAEEAPLGGLRPGRCDYIGRTVQREHWTDYVGPYGSGGPGPYE